ncbi:hypothetical protein SADUNF_Sadunf02G0102900 [Salix dunnii]|uniref:Uncharacterized protein n=1 Tax=Salix dunnii TaxID=1413687 RepID=A0A835TJK7_9ROSI|nr:hypothetical protein SADUNF_Sadunf02G0102900 [Salix dunnii]
MSFQSRQTQPGQSTGTESETKSKRDGKSSRAIQIIKVKNSKRWLRELCPLLAAYSILNTTLHEHFFPPNKAL